MFSNSLKGSRIPGLGPKVEVVEGKSWILSLVSWCVVKQYLTSTKGT